jgi:hypothetical protein
MDAGPSRSFSAAQRSSRSTRDAFPSTSATRRTHDDAGDSRCRAGRDEPSSASCRACARSKRCVARFPTRCRCTARSTSTRRRALAPSRERKIILATNVAETSLTVEGVSDVIDSGLQKVLRFDPETAVDHLVLEQISLDSADQRAGRAGRTGPGRATRLWDERMILRPHREPEVRRVDLASPVLDIVAWGGDARTFEWYERPPDNRIDAAIDLLRRLGAVILSRVDGEDQRIHGALDEGPSPSTPREQQR